ncbi:unnamed protein product [Medioppia subpectinata]|uniref:Uncharacterized protein n=1 Tax=Medioppia subpectinata TaxID=1979941 RepID=A0A7R9KHZ4_9ACAR|nr:unnamed protein product [Medioppia subpectinata]CAG2103644.1 unnamed protein product [Medioppia subpectinata]
MTDYSSSATKQISRSDVFYLLVNDSKRSDGIRCLCRRVVSFRFTFLIIKKPKKVMAIMTRIAVKPAIHSHRLSEDFSLSLTIGRRISNLEKVFRNAERRIVGPPTGDQLSRIGGRVYSQSMVCPLVKHKREFVGTGAVFVDKNGANPLSVCRQRLFGRFGALLTSPTVLVIAAAVVVAEIATIIDGKHGVEGLSVGPIDARSGGAVIRAILHERVGQPIPGLRIPPLHPILAINELTDPHLCGQWSGLGVGRRELIVFQPVAATRQPIHAYAMGVSDGIDHRVFAQSRFKMNAIFITFLVIVCGIQSHVCDFAFDYLILSTCRRPYNSLTSMISLPNHTVISFQFRYMFDVRLNATTNRVVMAIDPKRMQYSHLITNYFDHDFTRRRFFDVSMADHSVYMVLKQLNALSFNQERWDMDLRNIDTVFVDSIKSEIFVVKGDKFTTFSDNKNESKQWTQLSTLFPNSKYPLDAIHCNRTYSECYLYKGDKRKLYLKDRNNNFVFENETLLKSLGLPDGLDAFSEDIKTYDVIGVKEPPIPIRTTPKPTTPVTTESPDTTQFTFPSQTSPTPTDDIYTNYIIIDPEEEKALKRQKIRSKLDAIKERQSST